jgi:hypothetical protein
VLLIERGPGVETRPIKTSYSATAGTAYITFDNVRVPVENTLGQEGGGIFVILRYVADILPTTTTNHALCIATSITSGGLCVAVPPEARDQL